MNQTNFKSTGIKKTNEKFLTSKHDNDIQNIYMKGSNSQNFKNTINSNNNNTSKNLRLIIY